MEKNLPKIKVMNQLKGFSIPWERDKGEAFQLITQGLKSGRTKVVHLRNRNIIRSVAAIAILLISSGLFMRFFERSLQSANGEHLTHQLPDGSIIELNSGSSLNYNPFWWRFERSLRFEGEAFFMVQKGKTFRVKSELAETQVLGTSFSIFSRENNYRVVCHTGKVKVLSLLSDNSALLGPNQIASLEPNGRFGLSTKDVLPEPVPWKSRLFEFTGTPLKEVFDEIQRQYDVILKYPEDINYYYTGGIDANRDLITSLNLVCKPFKITFEEISKGEYQLFESADKDN